MTNFENNEILNQQIEYYRERAAEYDEWFYRRGRYDRGEEHTRNWFAEANQARDHLLSRGHFAETLELACGTGIWTEELLKISDKVTALDASPEVIALNRNRVNSERVEYRQVDLFSWEPEREYDLVYFSFWLSHVPPEKIDNFFDKVRRMVKPGGQVFMIDSLHEPTSTSKDHPLREDEEVIRTRKLNNGRIYQIVKVFYKPEEIEARLTALGFEAKMFATSHYFLYGGGVKNKV